MWAEPPESERTKTKTLIMTLIKEPSGGKKKKKKIKFQCRLGETY